MFFKFSKDTSRLKKKLLLYFILVSIVSLSVSAEIIFEVSAAKFRNDIRKNFYAELELRLPDKKTQQIIRDKVDSNKIFEPIYDLRNRMILLILVITGSIVGAFYFFTKDIVTPMEGMVNATQRLADGDLTAKVPVVSKDEIGLIAKLINEMNEKLLDMIVQVKQDLNRHKDKINAAASLIGEIVSDSRSDEIIDTRRMKISDFRKIMDLGKKVVSLLEVMSGDLTSLQNFVNMYKTYSIKTELSQEEIEEAIIKYNNKEESDGV